MPFDDNKDDLIVLLEDESIINKQIDGSDGEFIKRKIEVPKISYVFQNETVDIDPTQVSSDDNMIIMDLESSTGKISGITCLSDCWQSHESKEQNWQFTDSGECHTVKAYILSGSRSELEVEGANDNSENDIVPKADMQYATRLADLFAWRSKRIASLRD